MFKTSLLLGSLILATMNMGAAIAGPVSDFENSLHSAFADYRQALFHTNSNSQDKSAAAISAFNAKWSDLAVTYKTAPPQYADDPNFAATLEKVAAIARSSAQLVSKGEVAQAHDRLEAIREEIGALHERNGIISFSDRMNAYHARMEKVLKADFKPFGPNEMGNLRDEAAVLIYLAEALGEHPDGNPADENFKSLSAAVIKSVSDLHEAARMQDGAAAKKAIAKLKPAYSKLFLKFG